jgi:hypothetical protein
MWAAIPYCILYFYSHLLYISSPLCSAVQCRDNTRKSHKSHTSHYITATITYSLTASFHVWTFSWTYGFRSVFSLDSTTCHMAPIRNNWQNYWFLGLWKPDGITIFGLNNEYIFDIIFQHGSWFVVPQNWHSMHKINTDLITWISSISASFNEHFESFV